MTTINFEPRSRDAALEGVVARMSDDGWGQYHRLDCVYAPQRRTQGVRAVVHGPWRYLSHHWQPCPLCSPPMG
jgi:hypothetical protein